MPRSTRTFRGSAALLDDAGDDVALAARVLAEGHVVLGVPQPLQDDLLGGGGGDPAEAGGGVVELAEFTLVGCVGRVGCVGFGVGVGVGVGWRR